MVDDDDDDGGVRSAVSGNAASAVEDPEGGRGGGNHFLVNSIKYRNCNFFDVPLPPPFLVLVFWHFLGVFSEKRLGSVEGLGSVVVTHKSF